MPPYWAAVAAKNHLFKYLYDEIYTIGYYSGFYSSLRDKTWANCGNFGLSSNDNVCTHHFNQDKQMVTPFKKSEKV